jgi:threonylcarbamoyladenosine tRNA methylthiotransferase MtaB
MTFKVKEIKVALDSLGCKLNQAEIEHLARGLAAAGYRVVSPADGPDVYILNTCTVTHIADRKSRHLLRLARRRNPGVRLVAIGCYAERMPSDLEGIEGVEMVIGNDRKYGLVGILGELLKTTPPPPDTPLDIDENSRRTRSFIKVQDGCRNFCAYCIVPLVRSRLESVPADTVVSQAASRVAAGYREIVLTGTEIGTYNGDGLDLKGLLQRILDETGIVRLRLSSLQPPEITPELVKLWHDSRLCPHFHLSLQSGSDSVLNRMKRRYDTADYRRAVSMIRDSVPDVAITTDIIVGFPGETDAEFEASLAFCRDMRFARTHVFPYSPRPGTAAAVMKPVVPAAIKKQRSREMLALAEESALAFHKRFRDKTMDVLWEQRSGGVWSGLTGNYIKVYAASRDNLANYLAPVKLLAPYRDGVWGEMEKTKE